MSGDAPFAAPSASAGQRVTLANPVAGNDFHSRGPFGRGRPGNAQRTVTDACPVDL